MNDKPYGIVALILGLAGGLALYRLVGLTGSKSAGRCSACGAGAEIWRRTGR